MNIYHRGLHTKTWQSYMKKKLVPAAALVAEKQTALYAQSVRELYDELELGNPGNIAVSNDDSWLTRGHSSVPHWQVTLQRHNLTCTTLLSDGDSRAILALQDARVYGYISVEKEDCTNHVQNQNGTSLRNLITKHKGAGMESLGGKGKLTTELVTKLTRYYGWALKTHKGDVQGMKRAVMATYHHTTSNDLVSDHSFCPPGPSSWCRQNAASAKGLKGLRNPSLFSPLVRDFGSGESHVEPLGESHMESTAVKSRADPEYQSDRLHPRIPHGLDQGSREGPRRRG
ncbi:hypothetical protein HPB49_016633 [Dermacentor silvarum]|uniref:Uncharacterized protein n=1 Tax=Dermacentor silvarum TaxID=543639 RepID=A0ACB8DJZ4_DERSI|nr:hypothetical protein HPB49_016633 [Dermacentor silvarum]